MAMNIGELEALVPDFQYVDGERIVMTVGFTAAFYFWGGHTTAKRLALAECFEAFDAAFGGKLKWAFDEEEEGPIELSSGRWSPLRQQLQSLDEDDMISWFLTSADEWNGVGEYEVSCMTERGWMNGQPSSFRFHVPRELAFLPEAQAKLSDLIYFCHERLSPFHGNAGLTTVSTYDETEWEPEKLDVATRYLALYVDDRFSELTPAPNGLKSINWLTFVGDVLAERLGGARAFEDYCSRFGVHAIRNGKGYILRAGNVPELGPTENALPEEYKRVNDALRPLRNGAFGSMGSGSVNGELRFNRCTTDLWMRRFDKDGIWPPASLIGLGKKPVGTKPTKRVKLKTGEVCAAYGRYWNPALGFQFDDPEGDPVSEVVLMPGDIAPYQLKLGPHGQYLGRESIAWELRAEL